MVKTVETKEERQQLLDKGIKSIVIIETTPKDGAAYEAGLLPEDMILKVGSKEIITSLDLIKQLWYNDIGDTVDVVVIRDGKTLTIPVTLKEFKFTEKK
jgi:S1-C subfamily serine protease